MTVTASLVGDGMKRLRGLMEELTAVGTTECRIKPTKVLYWLSQMKGAAVLAIASRAMNERVKTEMIPYVSRAIEGRREGWERRAASAYRRWAYRVIEELFVEVRDRRGWGTVEDATLRKKEGGGVDGASRGVPPESWGVRHTRPDWRRIQKGQASSGKRHPSITESEAKIEVRVDGRVVAR